MLVDASDQAKIWRKRAAGMADLTEGLEVGEGAVDVRVGEQREKTSTEQEAGGGRRGGSRKRDLLCRMADRKSHS